MGRYLMFFILASLVLVSSAEAETGDAMLDRLEVELNSAIDDDGLIELRQGDSFLDPPGAVLFMSREAGARILVQMARDGEPELGMMYLLEWGAWVTHTIVRETDKLLIDPSYAAAAFATEYLVEFWHTHNNVGVPRDCDLERAREIQWTMPSPDDLKQLYVILHEQPWAWYCGVIASTLGLVTYCPDPRLPEGWAGATYPSFAIRIEGKQINEHAEATPFAKLKSFADRHEGVVKLKFEPMP